MPKQPHYDFDIEQQTPEWYAAKLGNVPRKYFPLYAVSKDGRVKNIKTGHILKPGIDPDGYSIVVLMDNGKRNCVKVHRLVASTFLNNPANKPQVNHKDGNKQNNNVENLEWVTNKENAHHAIATGLWHISGDKAPNAKINYNIAGEIRRLFSTGNYNKCQLGRMFGCSRTLVKLVVNNKLWV